MIYLHIGTDKTGSTAIQKLLHWNRETLEAHGLLYPRAGMMHYDHARLKIALDEGDDSPWVALQEELAAKPEMDAVLSHEGFYHLDGEKLLRLRDWLAGKDVRIILYLRRQDDMIESGMLQQIKTGERDYDLDHLEPDGLHWPHLDYRQVIDRWVSVFGYEHMAVLPYGRRFLPDEHAIYRGFLAELDRAEIALDSLHLPDRDPNPSLDAASARAVTFLRGLGITQGVNDAVVNLLLDYQLKFGKSKASLLSSPLRAAIMERYARSNASLDCLPVKLFSPDENEVPLPQQQEVSNRLDYLYRQRKYLVNCRAWFGEGTFVHLVRSGYLLLVQGFYPLEDWGCWSRGDQLSELIFRVPRTLQGDLDLHLKIKHVPGTRTKSLIRIGDNEAWKPLTEETRLRVSRRDYLTSFGLVRLQFRSEDAMSPFDAGVSDGDRRLLGMGVSSITYKELAVEK